MKKIFTIAALLFSVATFAAERPKPAKVSITSKSNSSIQVKIDGIQYTPGRFDATLENLKPGMHTVQVVKANRRGMFGIKRANVIYNSQVFVSSSQLLNIDINRFDNVSITKTDIGRGGRYDNDHDGYGNGRDSRDGRGRDNDNDRYGRH